MILNNEFFIFICQVLSIHLLWLTVKKNVSYWISLIHLDTRNTAVFKTFLKGILIPWIHGNGADCSDNSVYTSITKIILSVTCMFPMSRFRAKQASSMRIRLLIREVNSTISELVYTDRLLRSRYLYVKRKYLKISRLIFNMMWYYQF